MKKRSRAEALPDLGGLSKEERAILLACIHVRSRNFLLVGMYILLGEEFFTFLSEFAGKELRVPQRWVLKKYLGYARIYSSCKGRDLSDPKVLLEIAQANKLRKHQVVPIYKLVERILRNFTLFLRKEFEVVDQEVPTSAALAVKDEVDLPDEVKCSPDQPPLIVAEDPKPQQEEAESNSH